MKILTKKKQKEILELLIKSVTPVIIDEKVPLETFKEVNRANYDIAYLVGGFGILSRYHNALYKVIQDKKGE